MPMMLAKTYAALVAAGASEEAASQASEEIADFERRLTGIESRLANIEGDIRLIKWMLGLVIACVALPLVKLLFQ